MVWGRKNCMHAILARLCFGIAQFGILLGNRFLRWDSSPAIFRHEWHQGFCAIRSASIRSNIFKMLELYEAPETPIFRRIQTQLNVSRKNSWLKMATIKYVFVYLTALRRPKEVHLIGKDFGTYQMRSRSKAVCRWQWSPPPEKGTLLYYKHLCNFDTVWDTGAAFIRPGWNSLELSHQVSWIAPALARPRQFAAYISKGSTNGSVWSLILELVQVVPHASKPELLPPIRWV